MVYIRIVTLDTTTISASTSVSRVISPGGRNFLVRSALFFILCGRDLFNGALEVGTRSSRSGEDINLVLEDS